MIGTLTISETFMKILTTAFVAIVLVAIFFSLNEYNLIFLENKLDRESVVIGNAILSSCIVENTAAGYPVKGLLSEDKINDEIASNPTRTDNFCLLGYDKRIYVEVYDASGTLLYGTGDSSVCQSPPSPTCIKKVTTNTATSPAALNRTSEIIQVTLEIFFGV